MSDDIVKRLCVEITEEDFDRREIIDGVACWGHLHRRLRERINKDRADAANEILRLRTQLTEARKELRQIEADCNADYPPSPGALKYAIRDVLKMIKGGGNE